MNVMKLMAVALAGWINRQQQDVIGFHRERSHQGLENRIIEPEFGSVEKGEVGCRERLGGLLRYRYRDAA